MVALSTGIDIEFSHVIDIDIDNDIDVDIVSIKMLTSDWLTQNNTDIWLADFGNQ